MSLAWRFLCRWGSACCGSAPHGLQSPTSSSNSSERRPDPCATCSRRRSATHPLALWLPEPGSYVDSHGRPFRLPRPDSGRAVTVLGPSDDPVAALVHDGVLLEQRGCSRPPGPPRGSRSRTSVCKQSYVPSWPNCARLAHESCRQATRSGDASSATSTTVHNSGCSASDWRFNSPACRSEPKQTARPSSCQKPKTSCGRHSTSFASSPAASIQRSSRIEVSARQSALWPSARACR